MKTTQEVAAGIRGARLIVIDDPTYSTVAAIAKEFVDRSNVSGAGASPVQDASQTILFTDITESTRLTQRLGDDGAQELVRAHNALVREALAAHGGSEIKHTGDGMMVSFPSAGRALRCAAAIQQAIAAYQSEHRQAPLAVHIGVNAGEPLEEDQDLFGTAVQLARRICDHAEGGEILVSEVVRQLVAGKGFVFAARGERVLRGFEDAFRLYELLWRE
jgi:class 3 adenylate cyclase